MSIDWDWQIFQSAISIQQSAIPICSAWGFPPTLATVLDRAGPYVGLPTEAPEARRWESSQTMSKSCPLPAFSCQPGGAPLAADFQSSCPQLEAGSWKLEAFFQLNILQTVVLPVAPKPRGAKADVPHCTSQCEHCSKKKMVKPHG